MTLTLQCICHFSATEVFLAHTGAIQIRLLLLLLLLLLYYHICWNFAECVR